jgi:hypothetical protein
MMFNRVGKREFGAQAAVFDPETDGYHEEGSVLGTVLSGDGYRDNPFVQSGPEGVGGRWIYRDSAGGNQTEVPFALESNTTHQYTGGIRQLIGFEPEPGGQLDFIIEGGSARAYLTRNNNESSDPACDELEIIGYAIPPGDVAVLYVNKWLPSSDSKFYLRNDEIRAMINGGLGTRSYVDDLADLLYPDNLGFFDDLDDG